MMQNEAKFRVLEKKVLMSHLREKALYQYYMSQHGNSTKFDQMEKTDPVGTIIGPIEELHIVKILDE